MFDFSTEDLPSYIPGYEEWLEEREKETAYDEYIDNLIDERELGEKEVEKKEREEEEENEQKREKTI